MGFEGEIPPPALMLEMKRAKVNHLRNLPNRAEFARYQHSENDCGQLNSVRPKHANNLVSSQASPRRALVPQSTRKRQSIFPQLPVRDAVAWVQTIKVCGARQLLGGHGTPDIGPEVDDGNLLATKAKFTRWNLGDVFHFGCEKRTRYAHR